MALPPPRPKRPGDGPPQGPPGPPMGGPPPGMMDPMMAGAIGPGMMPPAPPAQIPPSAMGGPMTPGMDGPSPLLAALQGGGGMMSPNSSLDALLELLAQQNQAPSGQEGLMQQTGPGITPGPEDIDPQMLAMMMGGLPGGGGQYGGM